MPNFELTPRDKGLLPISISPLNLYAALDMSAGNKAFTNVQKDIVIVWRVYDLAEGEFSWFYSTIHENKSSGVTAFEASYRLGETLQKVHGIDYMEDTVWFPVEWIMRQ